MAITKPHNTAALDAAIYALGADVAQRMQGELPGVFNAQYWHGRLLEWVMKDPSFKVDLFRFVDVLRPSTRPTRSSSISANIYSKMVASCQG
jgi:Proline utilization A N-terminal domain